MDVGHSSLVNVDPGATLAELKAEACGQLFVLESEVGVTVSVLLDFQRQSCAECICKSQRSPVESISPHLPYTWQVELWDYWGGTCYQCLEPRLGETVSSSRLMPHQQLLLRVRQNSPSPTAEICLCETCSLSRRQHDTSFACVK
jgi:hypothetical protein